MGGTDDAAPPRSGAPAGASSAPISDEIPRFVGVYSPDTVPAEGDGRLHAPAATRNADAIAEALVPVLGARTGVVLEVGSGTGQHAARLATALPALTWQPTDIEAEHLASIEAWRRHAGLANLRPPLALDALTDWPASAEIAPLLPLAALFCANVIHISPWAVAEALIAGAGRTVGPGGLLILYGPYREGGAHTGEGNERFDAALRARNPEHGVRDIEAVAALATTAGFVAPAITRMPANNLMLAFEKA